ncbi:hypothetical protein OSB04_027523 [Centaurea solstitialis]|uniref:Fe2OG dioxygenase domain-containing protein n=1 Tax=Centaurea solstitialis TaxID=347529 RepID=A0AA38SXJ7_9ASTR|nr:hypothetical protein OSB04_027523 [Centaurea solstitialis]
MATKYSIPVIDLQDFPNQSSKLMAACEEWGCFRLINHHEVLPSTLMSEMKSVVRSLFDLPVEIKRQNLDVIVGSGYMAPTTKNPLHEGLGLYDMASHQDVNTFCSQLDASSHQRHSLFLYVYILGSLVLDIDISQDSRFFNIKIITKYARAVHELFMRIGEKLAEALGVKGENIGFENWRCQIRMNKYHFTPQSVGLSGVPIHTDSGFLTILQDDEDVGGLEVMDKFGHFFPVDPWPGTLIINVGDMATVWSNGRFCNVKHRVQCKEATIRLSIASSLLGPRETIGPLPELVDVDHSRVYVPTTYEDYRKLRLSTNFHAGEALELLQAPSCEN